MSSTYITFRQPSMASKCGEAGLARMLLSCLQVSMCSLQSH